FLFAEEPRDGEPHIAGSVDDGGNAPAVEPDEQAPGTEAAELHREHAQQQRPRQVQPAHLNGVVAEEKRRGDEAEDQDEQRHDAAELLDGAEAPAWNQPGREGTGVPDRQDVPAPGRYQGLAQPEQPQGAGRQHRQAERESVTRANDQGVQQQAPDVRERLVRVQVLREYLPGKGISRCLFLSSRNKLHRRPDRCAAWSNTGSLRSRTASRYRYRSVPGSERILGL